MGYRYVSVNREPAWPLMGKPHSRQPRYLGGQAAGAPEAWPRLSSSGLVKVSWLGQRVAGAAWGWQQWAGRIRIVRAEQNQTGRMGRLWLMDRPEAAWLGESACAQLHTGGCGVRQKSGWGEAGVWVEGIAKAEKRELSEA